MTEVRGYIARSLQILMLSFQSRLEDNVFFGRLTTILPGTLIGYNCVIGTGAVVRDKLEAAGFCASLPARQFWSIEEYKEKLVSVSLNCKQLSGPEKKHS